LANYDERLTATGRSLALGLEDAQQRLLGEQIGGAMPSTASPCTTGMAGRS
jgi:hypothetical protein